MKFTTLAGVMGGGQSSPGFVGHSKYNITQRKFIVGDGGLLRMVWMPKSLKEEIRERLLKRGEEVGIPDLVDRIADETVGLTEDEVLAFLKEKDLGFVCVDMPRLERLIPPIVRATTAIGYLRFHGRLAPTWWEHKEPSMRYDYLYSEEELQEWVPKIKELEAQTEVTYLFMNNHPGGKSVKNAGQLGLLLGVPIEIPQPRPEAEIPGEAKKERTLFD